jgi:hypothetical protein
MLLAAGCWLLEKGIISSGWALHRFSFRHVPTSSQKPIASSRNFVD